METRNTLKEYDVIVVGTGPGGASVAKELALNNKKVLILERGDFRPVTGTLLNTLPRLGIPGKGVLFTNRMVAMVRAITTGGSSVYYYGTAFDPPENILKKYGITIKDEISEIQKEVPVNPLPDEWIGPMSRRIMESACDLGLNWRKLNKFIYNDRLQERGNGSWGFMSAPNYQSKWNARMFIDTALASGADIVNYAKVTKVILEGNRAAGVEYRHNHKKKRAFAPVVVIAAGGIGTPVILRASGIKDAGYDFFFDPLIAVMGTAGDITVRPEIPMSTGIVFPEEGYVMTDMWVPPVLYMANAASALKLHRLFSHRKTLQIMIKARDSLGGRLTDSGGVRKKIADADYGKLKHGRERAEKILKNAGAKDIYKGWVFAAHPGGTVKIGDLVDSSLQTEYKNLYVCDCSVIPEEWGLPPTYTLLALGKRLAKMLSA
ncbi:MAG TPA: GMC family oxidoreductase N-terminal domain-containing protein [Spirochaetota bacterium]|nr:GMC family oxidoreductase N-terminal domain-containing protein [Spirochaetota bacterium]